MDFTTPIFTKLKAFTRHCMEIAYTEFPMRQEAWTAQTEINLLPTEKTNTQLIFRKLTSP
jgi:hypothetical protein